LFSNGMNRSYDDFRKETDPKVQILMDSLRKFCFALGNNVVEDVRMHRVVFCKSFVLRWFVDVEPQKDSILLKIQKSRGETQTVHLGIDQDLANIQALIREAYDSIH
jgi:predicted transport protein